MRTSVERPLAALQRPVRTRATTAAVLQTLATVLSITPAVAVVEIARRLLVDPTASVWPLAWLAVGLVAARVILYAAAGAISHLADADLALALRRRLADHLAALPLRWFSGGASGRVTSLVQDDVASLHHAVAHARGDLASAVAGPAVIVVYLFWIDWRLALLTVAVTGAAQAIRMRLAARSSSPMARVAAANRELSAATVELTQAIDVVKAYRQVGQSSRFSRAATAYIEADEEAQAIFVRGRSLTRATVAPATVVLVLAAAGTAFVAAGWTRPPDVIAFVLLGIGLFEQLSPIYAARDQRRRATAAAERLDELLTEPTEPRVTDAESETPQDPLVVSFDQVSFGYTSERQVLHDIDATLQPGTVTALVGPSGAGKSTLATLLARFDDPTSGAIRLGETDLRRISPGDLYRTVGFLFQETTLLRTTIRETIAMAAPDATDDQIRAAAQAASIHDRILRLPRGYDSVIGDDAVLSGGEQQRLSIARTLLADTPVVVLDEATAYADPESEAAVQDALARLAAGRTLLVVAHRLNTVTRADQILVLDDGHIVERGTHPDLLATNGRYAALWRAQQGDAVA
ncbi:ABC transporter ATP-binding protein [Kribbella sp. NPDC055071]